ncbi:unnamed protein product [Cyclocybe aegerita]|uniref:Uncharacterized protein n=1 Tax=Cyclocybe aegerita TaxID=1973307 RepID=A0A8S0VQR0_CYCAE|nr:unnamed protein product [Cyclocybe aegerita]
MEYSARSAFDRLITHLDQSLQACGKLSDQLLRITLANRTPYWDQMQRRFKALVARQSTLYRPLHNYQALQSLRMHESESNILLLSACNTAAIKEMRNVLVNQISNKAGAPREPAEASLRPTAFLGEVNFHPELSQLRPGKHGWMFAIFGEQKDFIKSAKSFRVIRNDSEDYGVYIASEIRGVSMLGLEFLTLDQQLRDEVLRVCSQTESSIDGLRQEVMFSRAPIACLFLRCVAKPPPSARPGEKAIGDFKQCAQPVAMHTPPPQPFGPHGILIRSATPTTRTRALQEAVEAQRRMLALIATASKPTSSSASGPFPTGNASPIGSTQYMSYPSAVHPPAGNISLASTQSFYEPAYEGYQNSHAAQRNGFQTGEAGLSFDETVAIHAESSERSTQSWPHNSEAHVGHVPANQYQADNFSQYGQPGHSNMNTWAPPYNPTLNEMQDDNAQWQATEEDPGPSHPSAFELAFRPYQS